MKNIQTLTDFQVFIQEKIDKSFHHARNVVDIIPHLTHSLLMYTNGLRTKYKDDDPYGNIIWFDINGSEYCVAYNHNTKKVDLRSRGQQGETISSWDNTTNPKEIIETFMSLKTGQTIYDLVQKVINKKISQRIHESLAP